MAFFARNREERLFDKSFDAENIVGRYAVKTAKGDQMLDRKLAFTALVFAVLFLPCVKNKSDLFLSIAVFEPKFL